MVKCSKSEIQRLKTALRGKIPAVQRERIQMVLLREGGLTQPAIAAAMGVSLSTVNRAHMAYHQGGIKALKPKPNGGRKHENMTLAEEKALLARVAKRAGAGEMLNIHDLKAAYEGRAGLPNPARQHLPPVRPRVCTDDFPQRVQNMRGGGRARAPRRPSAQPTALLRGDTTRKSRRANGHRGRACCRRPGAARRLAVRLINAAKLFLMSDPVNEICCT